MAFSEECARRLKERVRDVATAMSEEKNCDFSLCWGSAWKVVREALGRPYEDCSDDDLTIAFAALKSYIGEIDAV